MSKISLFFQYHNAVPIALGVLFLGAGGVFAATNPEAIYRMEQVVISIDNSYIVNKDLSLWTPSAVVRTVTDDDENYHVTYAFSTIELRDHVWQDVVNEETMTVSKANLGEYGDLGLYVIKELKQKIDRTLAYLEEVQAIERKQVSLKQVATVYSGLIGKMLDNTTETLPGYVPVVTPPAPPSPLIVIAAPAEPVLSPLPPPPVLPSPPPQQQVASLQDIASPTPTADASATSSPSSIEPSAPPQGEAIVEDELPPTAISNATSTATTTTISSEPSSSETATSTTTTPPQETTIGELPETPSDTTISATTTEHPSPEAATSSPATPTT